MSHTHSDGVVYMLTHLYGPYGVVYMLTHLYGPSLGLLCDVPRPHRQLSNKHFHSFGEHYRHLSTDHLCGGSHCVWGESHCVCVGGLIVCVGGVGVSLCVWGGVSLCEWGYNTHPDILIHSHDFLDSGQRKLWSLPMILHTHTHTHP